MEQVLDIWFHKKEFTSLSTLIIWLKGSDVLHW